MELSHYEKYGRKSYLKNKDKYRPLRRAWVSQNKPKHVLAVKRYVVRNKEKVDAYNASFAKTTAGRYRVIKYRHTKRQWRETLLTIDQYCMLERSPCFYCGGPTIGGLDRVDNEKGYSLANSVPCCTNCNMMKKNMTSAEFINHILRIYTYNYAAN